METVAGVSAVSRGISMPINLSQAPHKEWRVVAEQYVRNSSNEELEHSKLGLSNEGLMSEVQQGRKPADVDFCLVAMEGNLDSDILSHKLHSLVKQREELQQMENALRAKLIARDEIMEMRSAYDSQLTDHADANAKLQEHLLEKEQTILELERKLEEKERDLHAIRLHNEAAWAKDDLLREQSIELQTYRRERDNSETERAQHIKQIHDLQEHIQEKEQQFMEIQEQNRIVQETLLFKDEQLREAQAWMTRVQEMDAFQSTTNHSLQAELRERTEHCNQLWLGCQRQFGEMERLHLVIQQLQLELADAGEKNGTYSDGSHVSQQNSNNHSQIGENNGGQLDVGGNGTPQISGLVTNGNSDIASFISVGNTSRQPTEHVQSVPISPTSFVGMPPYLPPGQMAAMLPFVMHQQAVPSHIGPFHSVPAFSSLQNLHNQQPTHDQVESLENKSIKEITKALEGQSLIEDESKNLSSCNESSIKTSDVALPEPLDSTLSKGAVLVGKMSEAPLLDERVLLACIARTIPPGGKIRISSTLPNRLCKMIAPLNWHDYKRKYGKLDDFVATHSELFVIEGDFIQLRDGAQEAIAAVAAMAKVAAATSSFSSSSLSHLASIAMTPMADSHQFKKASSTEKPIKMNGFDNRVSKSNLLGVGKKDFVGSRNISSTHWRGANANGVGQQMNRTNGA